MFDSSNKYGRARLAISLIFAINGFVYANWTSRIPRIQELYGMDNGQLGLVLLALSIGALIAMPITGFIIVKVGSRRLTQAMLLFFLLTCPLLAVMPSYFAFAAIGLLVGMSTGALDVAMNAQAILVEEGLRKPIMSSFHAIFSLGMLLGAGSASLFIFLGVDVDLHLIIVAGLSLLLAAWCLRQLLPEPEVTNSTEGQKEHTGFRIHKVIVLLGLAAFCCMMGEGAMADWTTVYMLRIAESPEQWAPLGQAAFSGAMMVGRFAGDWARATYGSSILIKAGGVLALFGLTVALFFPTPILAFSGFLLVGLGLSNIVPIAYSVSGRIPGIPSGVGISSVTTIGYAGFLFGPPVIGFISDWHNKLWESGVNPNFLPFTESWRGLQLGLGFIWLLFVLLVVIAFFFLRIDDNPTTAAE